MIKKFMKKRLNQKGLTLVELLAVVVILGIIAAIAVPAIGGIIENTKENADIATDTMVENAAKFYFLENQDKTEVTIQELVDKDYLEDTPTWNNPTEVKTRVIKGSGVATGS